MSFSDSKQMPGGKYSELILAISVIGIVGVMLIPLPTFILDVLLTLNISFSLVVLMNAIYVRQPLQLSVFPSLMLVVTLFRLSLNVASTRLILGQGYAGNVISAFGTFVIKDNYVVGFVIFVILVAIQYLVIVRGTERNAEVGARFTLDAMPGKQMSIDADLNAGLINEEEALRRRDDITREASFYGSMDGAAKFVRGDAIAGIVITLVNLLAGFVVGMAQMGLTPGEALRTYTRLTIGDGLVSQIPALIISTSAGIVVSRAAASGNLGSEIHEQLFRARKPLLIVSGTLFCLALVPGIPTIPMMLLSLGTLLLAQANKRALAAHAAAERSEEERPNDSAAEESPEEYLHIDRIEVAIGYGLIPLVDKTSGSDFLERIVAMRRQIASEVGVIVPKIRVRDDIRIGPDTYEVRIKSHRVCTGRLQAGHYLAMGDPALLERIDGSDTKEPAFGLQAKWVNAGAKPKAEDLGLTVVSPSVVLATHLTEVIKSHAWEILTRQDTQRLLDEISKDSPALVKDVIPEVVTLSTVHRVLQNLLKERVPIRDFGTILEVIADFAPQVKEMDLLTEYVRAGLGRAISNAHLNDDRCMHVITLDPDLEHDMTRMLRDKNGGATILSPGDTQLFLAKLRAMMKDLLGKRVRPVLLCAPQVRLAVRRLTESSFPLQPVLSYHEVAPDIDVQSVGTLSLARRAAEGIVAETAGSTG